MLSATGFLAWAMGMQQSEPVGPGYVAVVTRGDDLMAVADAVQDVDDGQLVAAMGRHPSSTRMSHPTDQLAIRRARRGAR